MRSARAAADYLKLPGLHEVLRPEFLVHVQHTEDGYEKADRALAAVHSEHKHFLWARRAAAKLPPFDWFWITDLEGRVLLHTYANALCARCCCDVADDYYMVTDEVWHAVAADNPEAQLCLACLEHLVIDWRDTPLRAEDFKDIGLNDDSPAARRIRELYTADNRL